MARNYFVYRTTNTINGKTYIGVRKVKNDKSDEVYAIAKKPKESN